MMFKRTLLSISMAALLVTSLPSEAKFGGGSSSHSSPSRSYSAPAPTPRQSYVAPAPSRPTGGMSSGGNVGMQRQAVTRPVQAPSPAPTYGSYNRGSYGTSTNQSYSSHTTVVHHYSPSTGGGGFGMGSLAMAAMGGYMLNGIMHDHSGAVYNGAGYSNGVPTQGGQYYTQPQVGDVQQQVQQPMDSVQQPQPQPQVVYQQVQVDNSMPTWIKILLWITGIAIVVALIRRIFL